MKEMKTFLSENQTLRLDWMTPIWFHSVPSVVHDAISDMDPSRASELVFGDKSQEDNMENIKSYELTEILMDRHEGSLVSQFTVPVIDKKGAFSWGHIHTKVFIAKNEDDLIKQAKEWHKKETNAN